MQTAGPPQYWERSKLRHTFPHIIIETLDSARRPEFVNHAQILSIHFHGVVMLQKNSDFIALHYCVFYLCNGINTEAYLHPYFSTSKSTNPQ